MIKQVIVELLDEMHVYLFILKKRVDYYLNYERT